MIADWELSQFVQLRMEFSGLARDDVEEGIEQFLDEALDAVNQSQRVVLFAEEYDYQVLTTAQWLCDGYDVDVKCYRLILSAV